MFYFVTAALGHSCLSLISSSSAPFPAHCPPATTYLLVLEDLGLLLPQSLSVFCFLCLEHPSPRCLHISSTHALCLLRSHLCMMSDVIKNATAHLSFFPALFITLEASTSQQSYTYFLNCLSPCTRM